MSGYAWSGVICCAAACAFALLGYGVMAIPYFDRAPRLEDLSKRTTTTGVIGLALFGCFVAIFSLSTQVSTNDSSGPLLISTAMILGLPLSLTLGSATWARHDRQGMVKVSGLRAVAVATALGLVELFLIAAAFGCLLQCVW